MRVRRTGDQAWVREHNLSIIMTQIWHARSPIRRPHLTEICGLNKSTVGSLIGELLELDFVRWVGYEEPSKIGRPSRLIEINPDGGRVIGIEIGKDFISLILSDLQANMLSRLETSQSIDGKPLSKASPSQVMRSIEKLVNEAHSHIGNDRSKLLGIGVGIPGMIDSETEELISSSVLGWKRVNIKDRLIKKFNVPVFVGNDAEIAALGEWMVGAARDVHHFVYIGSNVGIGGGLFLDGKPYKGEYGFAGEIGHMAIDIHGPRCTCGNYGCLETYIRPTVIIKKLKEAAKEGKTPVLMEICGDKIERITMENIFRSATKGDPYVGEYLNEIALYLGVGIANLVNIFNPKMIVLGGVLSLAGEAFLEQVDGQVKNRLLHEYLPEIPIVPSSNGFYACAVGGIALVINALLRNPANWDKQL